MGNNIASGGLNRMNQIKIIIWDMDDTFWTGTLSEGNVVWNNRNIELVKKLTDRGIMNSIVSKNEYFSVKKELIEMGVWEYFIFPMISWNPKGETVAELLKMCKLRAENALFIDDNFSNLEEVKFYNSGINVSLPSYLDSDILTLEEFKGKNDSSHSRLNQYKMLEKRTVDERKSASNEAFLRNSGIHIQQNSECISQIDRIFELIERTNQLNFTKKRLDKVQLESLLNNSKITNRYITASDKYGDYGIIGFYSLKENKLEHFLFSCRILGLGIEKYIYNHLSCPDILIQGEVVSNLEQAKIDWITEDELQDKALENRKQDNIHALMVGGCDLQQTDFYLSNKYAIDKEFSTVIDGFEYRTSDSWQILGALNYSSTTKHKICNTVPFCHEEVTFMTNMFCGKYDYIIYSVVDDYIRALFKNRKDNFIIGCGGYFDYESCFTERCSREEMDVFFEEYEYIGRETLKQFKENLRCILKNIGSNTKVILINGCEQDVSEWIGLDRVERQVEMNNVVDQILSEFSNVSLIDMRKIVQSKADLSGVDNRHYTRNVYYRIAQEIASIINKDEGRRMYSVSKSRFIAQEIKEKIHGLLGK
jgi:FkbH-like protein